MRRESTNKVQKEFGDYLIGKLCIIQARQSDRVPSGR